VISPCARTYKRSLRIGDNLARVRALVLVSAISACDLPLFFSTPSGAPECKYQVDVRCSLSSFEGPFAHACRPSLSIDGCDFRVDSLCDPAFSFDGRITESGIETDDCIASGFEVACGRCVVTFVEDTATPYVLGESFCPAPDCESRFEKPLELGSGIRHPQLRVGWMPEIFVEEKPGYVLNSDYRSGIECPAGGVLVGFVGDPRRAGPDCLVQLERTPDGYFGVYGDGELMLGRFDFELRLERSLRLGPVIGEPGLDHYTPRSMAYDPSTMLLALSIASSTIAEHVLVVDVGSLSVVTSTTFPNRGTPREPLNVQVAGIASTAEGWIYVEDLDDRVVKTRIDDLGSEVRRTEDSLSVLLGLSDLGPMVVGRPEVFEGGILLANMAAGGDEIIILQEEQTQIAVRGTARALTDSVLTPTALAWADDLVAVGLYDRMTEAAHVGFFDPIALRFLPGTIEVGKGAVGRIRADGDRLWIGLPWQGKIVELKKR
jgi:hypothetical protein